MSELETTLPQGKYSVPEHELFLFTCFHQVKDDKDAMFKFLEYQQSNGNLDKYKKVEVTENE